MEFRSDDEWSRGGTDRGYSFLQNNHPTTSFSPIFFESSNCVSTRTVFVLLIVLLSSYSIPAVYPVYAQLRVRFFVCFPSYIFVRAPYGQNTNILTGERRPKTVVEFGARYEQCGSRGGRSKLLFYGS